MKRFSTPVALIMAATLITNCNLIGLQEDSSEAEQDALLQGLLTGVILENAGEFALNGVWNGFTGSGASANSVETISAESDATGIWLTDGSGYSTCVRLVSFNNTEGTFISQNPPNNGACYSGDSFKGKYFKGLFFKSTFNGKEVYWTCTIFDAKDSIAAAKEVADNTDRSTPESSGCGGSSWSRLEQVSNQ